MNYNHINETQETFDPDSKVVRSTQTIEQNATDINGKHNNAVSVAERVAGRPTATSQRHAEQIQQRRNRRDDQLRNLEDRAHQHSTDGGDVKRLSVAVVVDGDDSTDAAGKESYRPRTAKEMQQIEALVKSAIGFNQQRGDQVQVDEHAVRAHRCRSGRRRRRAPFLGLDAGDWFKIIEAAHPVADRAPDRASSSSAH